MGKVFLYGWEDLSKKFGQVFPCLEVFFCVSIDAERVLWDWGV